MERTPERPVRPEATTFAIAADENKSPRRSSRIKKNPSVTPKRFTKFFAPRLRNANRSVRTSRKALRDLSASNLNSRPGNDRLLCVHLDEQTNPPTKKRKLSFSSITSIPSSPIKHNGGFAGSPESTQIGRGLQSKNSDEACFDLGDDDEEELSTKHTFPLRVAPYQSMSSSAGLLSRRLGNRRPYMEGNHSDLWQHEMANFYSLPNDIFSQYDDHRQPRSLPFCAAGFKHNPLVAIGDEDGAVRIFQAWDRLPDFEHQKRFSRFFPHDNAIMDMEVSSNDRLLATASGDQTCRIIDVTKSVSTHTLVGHTGSIKRVQWQPGSGNDIVVTCSRDGSICLWDLRCARQAGSLKHHELRRETSQFLQDSREVNVRTEIRDAHTSFDKLRKGKRPHVPSGTRTDFAVTTCAFISDTRPHLLATASEHNAIIKLWDMRASYKQRSGRSTPVSATLEPRSHEMLRPFGVTSIAMSTDGSRLYSLCRDHTIYAYSTSHLVLGSCPEMSPTSAHPFRQSGTAGRGLGPLYGFRHPALRLGSFYSKLAVRPQTEEDSEMIAAGTGEECAVLFPTNERYLTSSAQRRPAPSSYLPTFSSASTSRPTALQRTSSTVALSDSHTPSSTSIDNNLPIYHHGTALVNGHKKEVTAVAWLMNGNLVTTADDYTARSWHEDAEQARALRLNKERDVSRAQCGWADVRIGFDEDDDEE